MKYTNMFISSYIALTFNIFCNHIKHSLIITLFSFSDNKLCENATLISKWLQQDTFIKMTLGYGWILSVCSLKTKIKSIKQKKACNSENRFFFLISRLVMLLIQTPAKLFQFLQNWILSSYSEVSTWSKN